jgi:hypothetical protein
VGGVSPSSQDPKESKDVTDGIASLNKQLELLRYQMQQRIQTMQGNNDNNNDNNNNASKRKTKICSKFAQHGCCPYADRCNFAHGEHELLVRALIPIILYRLRSLCFQCFVTLPSETQ